MKTPLVEILPHVPVFDALPAEAHADLARRVLVRDHPARTPLFRQGRRCDELRIVLGGAVKVYRAAADGREQILYIEEPRHTFGESALFNEARWPASAAAMEPVTELYVPRPVLRGLMEAYPVVGLRLMEAMARHLDALTCTLDKVTLHDLDARVAIRILQEATERGGCESGCGLTLPRTQDELASELGTTRESLARSLRHLRESGAIEQRGPHVRILDHSLLAGFAGGRDALPPCAAGGLCGPGLTPIR